MRGTADAREAGITQAYIFRMFGTKKALFLELTTDAFDRVSEGTLHAAEGTTGREALTRMGAEYYDLLADRTSLLLQLQGFAACGDADVREAVRARVASLWQVVADTTGLDAVTIKTFLAFGMMLNTATATPAGAVFPDEHGYTVAAVYVLPLLALSAAVILLSPRAPKVEFGD